MSDAVEGEVVTIPTERKPTQFDELTVNKLETAFNYDFNISEACQYAGINRTTYYDWLARDDIFSYRMSVAQAVPKKLAKEILMKAIQKGDPQLALRYLMLRDPDFKPKADVTTNPEQIETRQKIKEFLDDNRTDDVGEQPSAAPGVAAGDEVAQAAQDIPD
jgi:hypothetical protein